MISLICRKSIFLQSNNTVTILHKKKLFYNMKKKASKNEYSTVLISSQAILKSVIRYSELTLKFQLSGKFDIF